MFGPNITDRVTALIRWAQIRIQRARTTHLVRNGRVRLDSVAKKEQSIIGENLSAPSLTET